MQSYLNPSLTPLIPPYIRGDKWGVKGRNGGVIRGIGGVMKYLRNDPALKQRRQELRKKQTEAEKIFWKHMRNRQLYGMRFFRQYSVGPYILDFYCPQMRLAIELDGGQHTEDDKREYDEARSAYLQAQGIDIIRFWNHEVLHQTKSVLRRVAEKITPLTPP